MRGRKGERAGSSSALPFDTHEDKGRKGAVERRRLKMDETDIEREEENGREP
jgi:hypothetical protein